jgi:DNA polymerase-3 subunit delta
VAELSPVYLVTGDDDAKIDAWRRRLRSRAEAEGGAGALEAYDGADASPELVARALATLTFAVGRRYLLVDGVEAWKAGDLPPLERALEGFPAETTLVLIARGKALPRLGKAVEGAGGEIKEYAAPKPRALPKWTVDRALEVGLHLDLEAAKALVAVIGTRPQRILRELERLAILAHPQTRLTAEQVERCTAGESTHAPYELADALVAGDLRAALALAEDLAAREGRSAGLAYPIVRRLREVHRASELLEAGLPEQKVAGSLRMSPWVAKLTVGRARTADRAALERALIAFADLERDTRGGADLDAETAFTLALARSAPA